MKWIVGIDLRPSSQGAIRFAAWLGENSHEQESFVGIHVLSEEHLQVVLRYHHLDEVVDGARQAANDRCKQAEATSTVGELHVIQHLRADTGLVEQCQLHKADAVLVGRQAPRSGHHVVRLGKVARRMLRKLETPVVVVPPDMRAEHVGSGPVLVLSTMDDESAAACRFAAQTARSLGRSLVVGHVVPLPEDYGVQYLPKGTVETLRVEHEREGREALSKWLDGQGMSGARMEILQGHLIDHVIDRIQELETPMIVTGSRKLNVLERVLMTSVGSGLAAAAPCAVAVVPPEFGAPTDADS